MNYLDNPFFWTTIIATLVNLGMYLINRRTFKLLYEKPKILINEVLIYPVPRDEKESGKDCYLKLEILNPSSIQNLIVRRTLRPLFSRSSIDSGKANIKLPNFGKSPMHLSLNYDVASDYHRRWVLLTLQDIKGIKIRKLFRLKNTTPGLD